MCSTTAGGVLGTAEAIGRETSAVGTEPAVCMRRGIPATQSRLRREPLPREENRMVRPWSCSYSAGGATRIDRCAARARHQRTLRANEYHRKTARRERLPGVLAFTFEQEARTMASSAKGDCTPSASCVRSCPLPAISTRSSRPASRRAELDGAFAPRFAKNTAVAVEPWAISAMMARGSSLRGLSEAEHHADRRCGQPRQAAASSARVALAAGPEDDAQAACANLGVRSSGFAGVRPVYVHSR